MNNIYILPLKKPHLTVLFSILVTLILSIGSIWILVDDDFVKMFPDNIKSKKVWDDIHNNDTLIYNNFEVYFLKEFYLINSKELNKDE